MLHSRTMNFTDFVNSTIEEAFSGDAETMSTSSSEDASYTSAAGGGLWTTGMMSTLKQIVTDSLDEQIVTAGLLMLIWLYINFTNGSLCDQKRVLSPHSTVYDTGVLHDVRCFIL